jgi:hypothetical protein
MAVAVWDRIDTAPAYAAEVEMLERIAGRQAADALRAPFALGDREELATLFAGAGVASPAISTHQGRARFPSVRALMEADLKGWLPAVGVLLSEEEIQRILAEAEQVFGAYVTAEGWVELDLSAHIVTGARAG